MIPGGLNLGLMGGDKILYPENLRLWVPFDGSAVDLSQTNATPTVFGSPTYIAGPYGQSLDQGNADGNYTSYGDINSLDILHTGGLSVAAWIYHGGTATDAYSHCFYSKYVAAASGVRCQISAGNAGSPNRLEMLVGTGGAYQQKLTTQGLSVETWYRVLCVKELGSTASRISLYINGQLAAGTYPVNNVLTAINGTAASVKVGATNITTNYRLMRTQHVMAWDLPLTADDALADYNSF